MADVSTAAEPPDAPGKALWGTRAAPGVAVAAVLMAAVGPSNCVSVVLAIGLAVAMATTVLYILTVSMVTKPAAAPAGGGPAPMRPQPNPEAADTPIDTRNMLLKRSLSRALDATPLVYGGQMDRQHEMNQVINQCIEFFIEDYVEVWYRDVCGSDPALATQIKQLMWSLVDALHSRLQELDWETFLTRDLMIIWTNHLVNLRQCPLDKFPSHPCLVSEDAEVQYTREMAEVLLRSLLPPKATGSNMARCLARELFSGQVICGCVDLMADADFLNQYIIYRCEMTAQAREKKGAAFQNSADILKTIKRCTDVDVVTDLRYQIITEMMQIRHIEDMKRGATGHEDKQALDRMLELDAKAKELKSRNLDRYMHQLQYAKRECERQLVQLGGRDYRVGTTSLPASASSRSVPASPQQGRSVRRSTLGRILDSAIELVPSLEDDPRLKDDSKILTLPEIIGNGIAIGYFMEYLRKYRAVKNLKFWIATHTLLQVAETQFEVPCELIREVFVVMQSQSEDKSSLQIPKPLLDRITGVVTEFCNKHHALDTVDDAAHFCNVLVDRSQLVPFLQAQNAVYDFLYRHHYRKFVFSDQYTDYIKKLGESAHADLHKPKENVKPYDVKLGPGVTASWLSELERSELGGTPTAGLSLSGGGGGDGASGDGNGGSRTSSLGEAPGDTASLSASLSSAPSPAPSGTSGTSEPGFGGSQERLRDSIRQKRMMRELFPKDDSSEIGKIDEEITLLSSQLRRLEHREETVDDWSASVGQWDAKVLQAEEMPCAATPGRPGASPGKQGHITTVVLVQVYKIGNEGQGRIITRTTEDFTVLHEHLRECSDRLPEKPPWRAKSWSLLGSGKIKVEDLVKIFQRFLSDVLADQLLCASEALFQFLHPEALNFDGGIAVQPQDGHGSVSEAMSAPASRSVSGASGAGAGAEDDPEDDQDSVAEPVYGFINELFVLKGVFKWFRRQLIYFIKLTYGGTVNGNVESSLEWLFGPDQLVFYLESFRDSVFPPDWIPPPPRSTEEKAATRSEARKIFLDNLPEVLAKLVGQKNASIGATKLFESLQNTHVNKHLSYLFLERFVERLLPNVTPRKHLADDLIEMDASGATVRQAATDPRRASVVTMTDLGAGSPSGSRKGQNNAQI